MIEGKTNLKLKGILTIPLLEIKGGAFVQYLHREHH